MYQRKIYIELPKNKSKGFEEVVSQKSCNTEKVSKLWTNIVLVYLLHINLKNTKRKEKEKT